MTSEEKKLLNKMYDKEGHLTPLGKKVMAHKRAEITLNVSDVELNVLQVAIDHMIDHCSDVIGLESDEENELWVVRMHAAENLRLALNAQIKISNGQ